MHALNLALLTLVFTAIVFTVSGCGVSHLKEYEPKRRDYKPIVEEEEAKATKEPGSLFAERSDGATLFTDVRAFKVNDLVTVNILEVAKADRGSETNLSRGATLDYGADIGGILSPDQGAGFDPSQLLTAHGNNDFASRGETARRENVRFTVAATVKNVLPNGNLFIEGHRAVLVNDEEHHFYISGVARPEDISRDNTIMSSYLGDAEVEFTGRGIISEAQDPGWFTRLLNWISPL